MCSQTEIIASENNVGTLQVPWCVKKPDAVEDVVRSELGRGLAPLSTSPASSRSEATVLVNTCLWAWLPLTKQSQPLITPREKFNICCLNMVFSLSRIQRVQ